MDTTTFVSMIGLGMTLKAFWTQQIKGAAKMALERKQGVDPDLSGVEVPLLAPSVLQIFDSAFEEESNGLKADMESVPAEKTVAYGIVLSLDASLNNIEGAIQPLAAQQLLEAAKIMSGNTSVPEMAVALDTEEYSNSRKFLLRSDSGLKRMMNSIQTVSTVVFGIKKALQPNSIPHIASVASELARVATVLQHSTLIDRSKIEQYRVSMARSLGKASNDLLKGVVQTFGKPLTEQMLRNLF